MKINIGIVTAVLMLWFVSAPAAEDDYVRERLTMTADQIEDRGVRDPRVLAAMKTVPRHLFVPGPERDRAYDDRPLPIGYGQTISQPYIVAYMTEVLQLTGRENVLEIGTGSGYQAAVLSRTASRVHTVEIVPQLSQIARDRLAGLGYDNVNIKNDDGYFGWPENGPYDAIIVTCAAGHIPPPLIKQLKNGGRMVIPVGRPFSVQTLVLAEKDSLGKVRTKSLLSVRFVPLVRKDEPGK